FVNSLAKAVSRSQVIICCGKLFEKDGLVNVVSHAIRKNLTVIDNNQYGIMDNSEISITQGAVPLVNADGCFCGCIIESGPQSIILLTDNKSIRKTVLKSLIHPYIEELSLLSHKPNLSEDKTTETEEINVVNVPPAAEPSVVTDLDITAEEATEEETPETEELPETVDENSDSVTDEETATVTEENDTTEENDGASEEIAGDEASETDSDNSASEAESVSEEQESAPEIYVPEVIMDAGDDDGDNTNFMEVDPAEINNGYGLYLEPERVKFSKKSHYAIDYTPSEMDNAFISSEDDEYFDKKSNNNSLNIPILILVIVLLISLAALAYILLFIPMQSNYTFSEYIRHIFSVAVNINTF
ncbi:MAG: hypothetical protein IKK24_02630, partial [Clostridia bacterium]|nr:hypothetical protein [Clostridia bacterium]